MRSPSVELSVRVAVIAEYRRHALGTADIADGGGVSSYVIQRILHRQLRVRLQDLRLGAAVISHEIRPDEFVVESLESVTNRVAKIQKASRSVINDAPFFYGDKTLRLYSRCKLATLSRHDCRDTSKPIPDFFSFRQKFSRLR